MAYDNSRENTFGDKYDQSSSYDDKKQWSKSYKERLDEKKKQDKKLIDELDIYEKQLDRERQNEIHDRDIEHLKEVNEKVRKYYQEHGDYVKSAANYLNEKVENFKESVKDGSLFKDISGTLTKQLDPIINRYLDSQIAISAHLSGSSSSLSQLTDNLNRTLSSTGLVKQEAVYNRLASLVESGIVSNVEQKAFLLTLADDMHMTFDAANGNLSRLMRLQNEDLTANRLALSYNLQEFLNQTYENSQYIKDAFNSVSESLLEMRALNASSGAGVENTLQTWLGALYSNGLSSSTATSLAGAFNALGSGDISNLGQGISNLVLMGVARAGLDYGDILNSGLNANQTNQIMSGISTYLQEMGANSSNVVKSQLASIFGVNVADIIAANNTGVVNTTMNDNIGNLLGDYGGFVSLPRQMKNMLENMMYTWGTGIASSPLAYGSYEIEKFVSANVAPIVGAIFGDRAGNLVAAAPLLTLVPTLIESLGDFGSSIARTGFLNQNLAGVFGALGSGGASPTTVKISGGGTSASAYVGNGNMSGMFSNTKTSAMDITDTLNVEGVKPEWEDNVALITENTTAMITVMDETMYDIKEDINYIKNDFVMLNTAIQALTGNVVGTVTTLGGLI